jgi:hypothetical protein
MRRLLHSQAAYLPLAAWLALVLGGTSGPAQATPFPIVCYLSYTAVTSTGGGTPSPTMRDRTCAVEIAFKDTAGNFANRSYSCRILAGHSSCTTTVDPAASGVPASYAIAVTGPAPFASPTEEIDGCAYSTFTNGGLTGTPPGMIMFYPITFTDPSPEMPTAANPYPYFRSDPMPATTSITGSATWGVVVLHAFDCATVPTPGSP